MRTRLGAVLSVAVLLGCVTPSVRAWNKSGHMVVAALAYRDLKKSDPDKAGRVIALLKEHPHFESRWKSQLKTVPAEDQDQYLFMLAARWPDDIRGNPEFNRPKHHFIDFPFVPPDQPASVRGVDPDPENLVNSFRDNTNLLSGGANAADKAVALAWIFHQVGDIHQPLHAATLFTIDFPPPEGDRGGTRFFIRTNDHARTISLHKFWDDLLGSSNRFSSVRNRAIELSLRPEMDRGTFPQLSRLDIEDWAKESFAVATSIAYRNGDLEGTKDRNDGEVLPEDYLPEVQASAHRQAVLAGYRLADVLRSAF